jgi:hypothetical protein
MAQTRKQKVIEQVQRKRRERTIITFTIVAVLIAIIVGAILFLPRPAPNPVQLPPYLDHCVTGTLVYHSHPDLVVTISGIVQTLPITFETGYDGGCSRVIHTHTSDGVLHVETDQDVNYTIGDWFLIWGHWAGSTTTATLNSTQIFNDKVGNGHTLSMTVNGSVDTNPADFKGSNPADFQNLWIPRDAQTGQNSCTPVPVTGCVPFNIAITYT